MERTAGTMAQSGTTIDETIGLITAGYAQLRNVEKVSTSLITLSARLRGVDEDGEEIDGLSASLTRSFGEIGVAIEDTNGDLRSVYDIMQDYSKVLPTLTSEQKQYYAELAAGKRNVTTWNAITRQFADAEKAVASSLDSSGSAAVENAKYLDSLAGKTEKFNSAFQKLSSDVMDSDFLKGLIDSGTVLLNVLDKIVDVFGVMPTLTAGITAGLGVKNIGIFSTIDDSVDKNRKTLALFNKDWDTYKKNWQNSTGGINSKLGTIFNSNDINCLKEYNKQLKNGIQPSIAYKNTMSNCTAEAKKNAVAIAKGTTTIETLEQGQKTATASTIGLTVAQTALNAVIGIGIGFVVSLAIKGITKLINYQDDLIDKMDESVAKFEEQRNILTSNKTTIDEISSDYSRLSQGVDNLGRNISLSSDEYAKYNDIVNQIADMFPQMIQGYTDEGNAIITNKGNVEALTQAYKEQKQAYLDTIITQSADTFSGYKAKVIETTWQERNKGSYGEYALAEQKKYVDGWIKSLEEGKTAYSEFYSEILNDTSKQNAFTSAARTAGYNFQIGGTLDDRYMIAMDAMNLNKLKAYASELQRQINTETAKIKPIMQAYMERSYDYQRLDSDVQDVVSQIVSQFDSEFYQQFDNETDMANWVTDNIVNKFNGVDGKKIAESFASAFDLKTQFQNGEITLDEYLSGVQDFKTFIDGFDDNTKKSVELIFSVNSAGGLNVDILVNNVKGKLQDKFDDKVGTLSLGDLDIASKLEIDENAPISWDELIEKIEEYKESIKELTLKPFSLTDFSTAIESISKVSTVYKEFKQNIEDGIAPTIDLSSIESLRKELVSVDGSVGVTTEEFEKFETVLSSSTSTADDIQRAFNSLMTTYLISSGVLDGLTRSNRELIVSQLELQGVVNAAEVVTDGLAEASEYLISQNTSLSQSTLKNANAFLKEADASEDAKAALTLYALEKANANKTAFSTAADIQNIMNLCGALGYATTALNAYNKLKSGITSSTGNTIADMEREKGFRTNAQKEIDDAINGIQAQLNGGADYKPAIESSSKAGKDSADAYLEAYEKEYKQLQYLRDMGVINESQYLNKLKSLYESYFRDRKKYISEYQKYEKEYFDGLNSVMKSVVDTVADTIDDKVDELNKQKTAVEEYYQEQIDGIRETIDEMQNENDEIDRNMKLQKAKYNLAKALNQRNALIYRDGQFVYENDASAVLEAQEEVKQAELDKVVGDLEDSIESLEKAMKSETDVIDDQIKSLEEYRDAFKDVVTDVERGVNKQIAAEILGKDWENDILNKRMDTLTNFKNQYLQLQQDMQNAATQTANAMGNAPATSSNTTNNTTQKDTSGGKPEPVLYVYDGNTYSTKEEAISVRSKKLAALSEERASIKQKISQTTSSPMPTAEKKRQLEYYNKLLEQKIIEYNKYNAMSITKAAKGGVITPQSVGEDAHVFVKYGERILTKQQNYNFEKLINMSESLIKTFGSFQNLSKAPTYENFNTNNSSTVNNNTFHVTLPNITDSSKATDLLREFENLTTKGVQYFNKI